jgi:predicted metalloprotease
VALVDGTARALYEDPIEGRADFAVAYLVALGWAELVQSRLGSTLAGEERALASDCLVGAWTRDLDPFRENRPGEGDDRGTISPGDLDEAVVAAITLGDPAFDDDVIGSAFEKIDSFRQGVLEGLESCTARFGR